MAIYRGDGGAGDANTDITINQVTEKASEASASATAAASSATSASTSASNASTSETNASNSATAAASSATSAATSATNASTSASTASTQASNASTSATAASTAQTAAETAQTAAETAETNAETAETNAAASATTATTKASEASTSATNAATSATTATTKASEASTSASNAATSESNASTSETNAASSASAAATSATNAATSATAAAASATAAAAELETAALKANNLSDLASASTARTNLGLGTAATTASTDYATAAQGTTADSALQNIVEDTTPQLGGNLDTQTFTVDGRDVSTDGTKLDTIATSATANPDAIDNVVEDTTPQLGGDLDTNTNHIYTANGGIVTRPNAKPLIINGDMAIAQRSTSTTGITSTTMEVQDRWSDVMGGAGTWTQSSDTDVPTGQGFAKSMKWDCTATASIVAGSVFTIRYIFEGQDLQLLKYGTSNAEKVTLAFWIKSPVTGTHIASLYQFDDNRQVSKAYTVSSADTWQKVVLDFPADTTGVIDNDNGAGLAIELCFRAGSNYTSGTLNTSWASYTAANQYVGQVDACASTANNIYLTGVQLEVGEYDSTTIPPFQHESYGDSLIRCQRYFQKYTQPPLIGSANATNTVARASFGLVTSMRTGATATHNGTFSWFYSNTHQPQSTAFSATYTDENTFEADVTMTSSGMTATHPCSVYQSGSASLDLSAEL